MIPLGQQTPHTCGPASLCWVAARLGLSCLEEELVGPCNTTLGGTNHLDLARGARSLGLRAYPRRGIDLADLAPERTIVGWDRAPRVGQEPVDDHYSVFLRLTQRHVVLMDPWPVKRGAVARLPVRDFLRRWYDLDGPADRVVRCWSLELALPG